MFSILDRQLIYNYLKAYCFALVSLLGLFIVVDLFTNLDDFTTQKQSVQGALRHIGAYYGYKSFQIFDRLCEAVVLLAAMFTVTWMQRNNEILPFLSAGVSTRRVVQPVLVSAFFMLSLSVLNQELVLPNIDSFLVENRSNPEGDKETEVKGAYESNGIHLSGKLAYKKELKVKDFFTVFPNSLGSEGLVTLQAKEAFYVPAKFEDGKQAPRSGGWLLTGTTPAELGNWSRTDLLDNDVGVGRYFLYTQDVDFATLTRPKNWFSFMNTYRLLREMDRPDNAQQANLAVIFHTRLTRPLLGMILVLLGLSIILRDQNRNIFISAGMCLGLCGAFFAALFACQALGNAQHLSPAFAAWLPVILFGPLSFVMFDAVHT